LTGLYVQYPDGDQLLVANPANNGVNLRLPFASADMIYFGGESDSKVEAAVISELSDLPISDVNQELVNIRRLSVTLFLASNE
jgi:hypothetical protein